jgi:hypothetical protein
MPQLSPCVPTSVDAAMAKLATDVGLLCQLAGFDASRFCELLLETAALHPKETQDSNKQSHVPVQLADVLSAWDANGRFLGPDGAPRPLTYDAPASEFSELCAAVDSELEPSYALQTLIDHHAARIDGTHIFFCRRTLTLTSRSAHARQVIAEAAAAYMATLVHNCASTTDSERWFQRDAICLQLDTRYVPALLAYLNTQGTAFLEDADLWMSSRTGSTNTVACGVGMYFFVRS